MTGEEGIEDGDVEEEIRRELEALNDREDDEETTDLPGSMVRQKCLFILENKLVSGAYYDT